MLPGFGSETQQGDTTFKGSRSVRAFLACRAATTISLALGSFNMVVDFGGFCHENKAGKPTVQLQVLPFGFNKQMESWTLRKENTDHMERF